ncbi:Uncharacterized protein C4orf45, partial [Chaetura pelagica]
GPDIIGAYRTRKPEHNPYIGMIPPAIEGSSDANYRWHPASHPSYISSHRPQYPGEIGWGVRVLSHFTRKHLQSREQIKLRKTLFAVEDQATHWYQGAWQLACSVLEQQGHNARARLAWDQGTQEVCLHPHSKQAAITLALQAPPLPKSKGE